MKQRHFAHGSEAVCSGPAPACRWFGFAPLLSFSTQDAFHGRRQQCKRPSQIAQARFKLLLTVYWPKLLTQSDLVNRRSKESRYLHDNNTTYLTRRRSAFIICHSGVVAKMEGSRKGRDVNIFRENIFFNMLLLKILILSFISLK